MIKGTLNSDLMSICVRLFIQGCMQKHNDKGDIEHRCNVHIFEWGSLYSQGCIQEHIGKWGTQMI